jgi:outer membrane lipoprotein-sorting protein
MKKYFIFVLLITSVNLFAQQKDAKKLLDAVVHKFNKVNDYEADIAVKVDISFLKVPETKAKVYFKQPDKVKIDSKGFAMLPKQSVNFSPVELLNGDYNAFYVKSETIDNRKLDVVKIIPNNDSLDIILSTLWIDDAQSIIRKVETNGKKTGTTTIMLEYENPTYSIPSKVTFSFNLGNMTMPKQLQEKQDPDEQKGNHDRRQQSLSGSVILIYSNYKINKGIPDSFFEKAEKK